MTAPVSKNITPDSLTGILFGVEGVRNTIVLLNGPMGCKFYHSTTSQFLMDRPPLYLPITDNGRKVEVNYNFMNSFFFRQSRVPCTYLDQYDYVYGTAEKVEEALRYIRDHVDFDLLTVVNSPGASLIGDNLRELCTKVLPDRDTVHIESPGYSESFAAGYENAALRTLQQLSPRMNTAFRKGSGKSVNLLGLSIWHRYAQGDREELSRLLELCGIRVNCCLFSGCSVEELFDLPQADLNIVLHADMARETAEYLKNTYGTPYHLCDGMPVGFDATEELFTAIGRALNVDVSPVLQESERSRGLAWYKIHGIYQAYGLPKGALFALEGSACEALGYTRFLADYLGMVPESLKCEEGAPSVTWRALESLLQELKCPDATKQDIYETKAELVFGNANLISSLMTRTDAFCGIEISLPGMGYTDIIPKTHLGLKGALFLTEQVLNGLMSRL